MWFFYELAVLFGFLAYLPKAFLRRRLPHPGWSMRLGRYPAGRLPSDGRRPVWLHAVSVGETLAARPLIDGLLKHPEGSPLVVSSVTSGGHGVAASHLGTRGAAIYFPLDFTFSVDRALAAVRPRVLVLMESELWPNMIRRCRAQGIPVVVVNGRVSARSVRRAGMAAGGMRWLVNQVDLFLMQSQADADRLLALGAARNKVRVAGNLKWDASIASRPDGRAVEAERARLRLAGDPVLAAGSTHRGEEAAVLHAFARVRRSRPSARLILAPRHLERLQEVEQLVADAGLTRFRLSQAPAGADWHVGIVDTFGRLPLYYSLSDAVFIGGSLIPHGGQNPLEATSLGKPVAFGPFMGNFEAIVHELLAQHAAVRVQSGEELGELLELLLEHPDRASTMGRQAKEVTERFQGATHRTITALKPFLSRESA